MVVGFLIPVYFSPDTGARGLPQGVKAARGSFGCRRSLCARERTSYERRRGDEEIAAGGFGHGFRVAQGGLIGRERYPTAKRLLITADGGGSNGSRCEIGDNAWVLARLAAGS